VEEEYRTYGGNDMSSTTDVVNTAIAGVIGIKVLEVGMNVINDKKPKKIKKLKPISKMNKIKW
jgi:hypothetical protein